MQLVMGTESPALLNDKTRVICDSCLAWFNAHPDHIETLVKILRRQECFSLRLVDWTVTNYSKKHRLSFLFRNVPLDLHDDYHRFLSVFNKKLFDPFARRERITLVLSETEEMVLTTVGQLNFMKWFLERGLDRLVQHHRHEIETDMKGLQRVDKACVASDCPPVETETRHHIHHGHFALTF